MEPVMPYIEARMGTNTSAVIRVTGNGGAIVEINGTKYLKPFSDVVVTTHPQIASILAKIFSKSLLGEKLEPGESAAFKFYREWSRNPVNAGKSFRPNWYEFYKMSKGEANALVGYVIDPGQGGHPL